MNGLSSVMGLWDRALAVPALLFCAACQREIPPGVVPPVSGFQVSGTVTDGIGHPVSGATINLYYLYNIVDNNPPPSIDYIVQPPSQIIIVAVFDRNQSRFRTLYQGSQSAGSFTYRWDQRDTQGNPAPSGLYWVEYIVGGETKKSYPVVITGNRVTSSDSAGHYTIPDLNLPVGFYPVVEYSADSSTTYGNSSVGSTVFVEAVVANRRVGRYVDLTRDQTSPGDMSFR